jgi:integrase
LNQALPTLAITERSSSKTCSRKTPSEVNVWLPRRPRYNWITQSRITDETLNLLLQLAEEAGLRARTDAMFGGEARLPCGQSRPDLVADHAEAFPEEASVETCQALHTGQRQGDPRKLRWSAHDGERITLRRGKGGGSVDPVHEGAQAHARRYVEKAPSLLSVPAGTEHGRRLVEAEKRPLGRGRRGPHRSVLALND